jgi:hypothetical protein
MPEEIRIPRLLPGTQAIDNAVKISFAYARDHDAHAVI